MSSTTAQDEFNAIVNRSDNHSAPHPEDRQTSSASPSPPPDESSSKMGYSNTIRSSNINPDSSDSDTNNPHPKKSKTFLPRQRSQANTGPKGVIADAQAFHQAKRAYRSAATSRANLNSTSPPLEQAHWTTGSTRAGSEELDDDYEDGDDEFMANWRQRRMQELLATQGRGIKSSGGKKGVVKVDTEGYLDVLERAPKESVVAVYIYDDKSEVSTLMESHLSTIQQRNANVRCIKLHYIDAQMDPAGVPALIAYRGGEKFAALVPLLDDLIDGMNEDEADEDVSVELLEGALRRHRILP